MSIAKFTIELGHFMTLQPYQKDWAMQSQLTEISNEDMMRRRELYLQCFDDLTGNAAGKYTNTIINVINQRRVVQ